MKWAVDHPLVPEAPRARTRQNTSDAGSCTVGVARRFTVMVRYSVLVNPDPAETSTS